MAVLELESVTKAFGGFKAVDNLSLKVSDGEFLVLLGPSGSGKTTVLRIISGLERPSSGRVIIDGKDVTMLPPKQRDVAMVFQNYALYPHMKVFDNIALPLRVRGLREEEINKKVTQVAELLQIAHILYKKPSQVSGGEQQRVAVARAIVRNPKIFLFDEPLSNLDAKLRVTTRGFLKRLQKELGVTTVYVTHDQSEAMTMADRIAVINQGRLLQVSSPSEIYRRPADIFVAGFIGSPPMNLLQGKIKRTNGTSFVSGKISVELDVKDLPEELVLGIRPEDIIISNNYDDGCIEGSVYVTEPLGNLQYVTIDASGTKLVAQAESSLKFEINSRVWFKFRKDSVHLFAASGKRLN